jgi:two-component system, chemotaxis family, CheB/CheR fusion protein
MSKKSQSQHAPQDDAGATGNPTGRGNCPVMVVGIGASERGLNSVKEMFARMPSGYGVAFVLIQHLGPSQENLAVKELSDQTALTVVEATDGMDVLADRIHVMPANKFLNLTGSVLSLQEPVECNGVWMPIDHFFCALAVDQGGRGCGILLTGTGSDGSLGLSEIKATGGRTIVEKPGSAELAAITQRAINAGLVDVVVPIEAMAETIVALAEQVIADTRCLPTESPEFDASLKDILDILRAKVGHDFRCYKPNTLVRRTRRRMTLAKMTTFAEYANFLVEHPEEVGLLRKDLLIGVTDFFRQPQAWDVLERKVIADIIEKAEPGAEIRVWVPGCSTGQEVYSLAMLLAEKVETTDKKVAIQLFATDSDVASFGIARSGTYSTEVIGKNVSRERLKRFFTRKDDQYQVIKKLREQIVFAPQNLTSDPPFSRLDLISCRNLLMYLEQSVQQKIIALFHFSLREGGYLFLGTAETVGDREDLFEPISKKWRIYRRIGVGRPVGVDIPVRPTSEPVLAAGRMPMAAPRSRFSLTSAAHQMLLDRFTPACVMIDRRLQVLYVHGAVENYLTFPPGELTTRVVDMAREGLRARLRGAIGKSLEVGKPVSITARVRRGSTGLTTGGQKSVAVKATVSPLRYPREVDGLLLISFEDYRLPTLGAPPKDDGKSDLQQLEDELKITREDLQSNIEQVKTSNDQLKAYNEEVTAANEELQSANEELETSKEELQSLNEELNTINARLQDKVEELEGVNNDVINLLSSTNIATVFLDKELKVKRYTPASTRLFSLIPSDIGRPIRDILRHFADSVLLEEAARVLADLTPLSKEVRCEDGRWYIRRITPYRTQDDRIEGVVVTFSEVTELKHSVDALRRAKEEWERTFNSVPDLIAILDERHRVVRANRAMAERLGRTPDECVGLPCYTAVHGMDVPPDFCPHARTLIDCLEHTAEVHEERLGGHFLVSTTPICDEQGKMIGSVHVARDITERKKAEEMIRSVALFPEENPFPILRVAGDATLVYANRAAEALLRQWQCQVGTPVPEFVRSKLSTALGNGTRQELEVRFGEQELSFVLVPIIERGYVNFYGRDITERKRAEDALQRERSVLDGIMKATDVMLVYLDPDFNFVAVNPAYAETCKMRPEDMIGKNHFTLYPDEENEAIFRRVRDTGEPAFYKDKPFEFPDQPERGVTYWDWSLTPVKDAPGKVIGLVFSLRETTKYKKAEEALRESEERYRSLFDNMTEGFALHEIITDENGRPCDYRFLSINPSFERLTGLKRADVLGKRVLEVLPDNDPHWIEAYGKVALSGEPMCFENFATPLNRWYEVLAYRTAPRQFAVIFMDISDRKRAEEELRKSRDELELRVQERTEELESRNKELQEFVFVAAHDLREPLRKIQTFGDLVAKKSGDGLTDASRDFINRMQRAAATMQKLLESLLGYSRVTTHAEPFQDTDLSKSLDVALSNLEIVVTEKKARLEVGQLPTLQADRVQMIQLFQNLISNALKFQDRDHLPCVKIYAKAIENKFGRKSAYEICVEDNGIGFEEQYLDKIFKPFQRLHGREEYEGVGIGLAICRKIVERHGGTITARSTIGQGSNFIVTLPMRHGSRDR